jgi:hypothetical protein
MSFPSVRFVRGLATRAAPLVQFAFHPVGHALGECRSTTHYLRFVGEFVVGEMTDGDP